MNNDELDRILSNEPKIVPSSRFVSSVMQAVRTEAATPPPIPFPWTRALPGIAAWFVTIVWAVVNYVSPSEEQVVSIIGSLASYIPSRLMSDVETAQMLGVGWICVSLLMTYCSMKLARYVVSRSAY